MANIEGKMVVYRDGDNVCIALPNGYTVVFPHYPNPVDFVAVAESRPPFGEVFRWISDEWRDEPEEVMGAILGVLCAENKDIDDILVED